MKYDKLIFIYPFSIGSFLNAKIGMEATLEEGDNINECFDKLSREVKMQAYKEQNNVTTPDWMFDQHLGKVTDEELQAGTFTVPFNNNTPTPKEEERIGVLASDIESCTNLKILETYRFIKETKPELKKAYDKRYEELKNQEQ